MAGTSCSDTGRQASLHALCFHVPAIVMDFIVFAFVSMTLFALIAMCTRAGFMQNEYFDDQYGLTQPDLKFGTRIQQKVLGNIHDHLTSWKVDLDINGTANSFHRTVQILMHCNERSCRKALSSNVVAFCTSKALNAHAFTSIEFNQNL